VVGALLLSAQAASGENNGLATSPLMGWSSWSFIRRDPTAVNIEAQAQALVSSGLARVGYDYVNVDDYWYQCPGSQGPAVDANGRWVANTTEFPNGIAAVASYVHNLGLKFGIYVTPGVSKQAVVQDSPILGTNDTVDDFATTRSEANYNCGGMVGIKYSDPGAQAFINSWADEFASWGVDYLKLDGVGQSDVADVRAWSTALRQSGRPIALELSNNLSVSDARTWRSLANGWRIDLDIECNCGANGSSYPLADWSKVVQRFDSAGRWQPYAGPGKGGGRGWNDLDSVEVGNGPTDDGLTTNEEQSQLSLWSLASSPLILGTDLTNLNATDLDLLLNTNVIAVDQDAIPGDQLINNGDEQVFDKRQGNGQFVIGVFNEDSTASHTWSVPLAQAGISGTASLTNLWSGTSLGTASMLTTTVPAGGVTLVRATPTAGTGGTGELVDQRSRKCLDITGVSYLPGTRAEIWTCNGGLNQQFTPTSSGELRTMGATECLDVTDASTAPGTKVELRPCNGRANQRWTVNSNGTIVGSQSGLCLNVTGALTSNGAPVETWPCNGGASEQWSHP
jgi:alpha-galactosidase